MVELDFIYALKEHIRLQDKINKLLGDVSYTIILVQLRCTI